jgi:hypothetical protein
LAYPYSPRLLRQLLHQEISCTNLELLATEGCQKLIKSAKKATSKKEAKLARKVKSVNKSQILKNLCQYKSLPIGSKTTRRVDQWSHQHTSGCKIDQPSQQFYWCKIVWRCGHFCKIDKGILTNPPLSSKRSDQIKVRRKKSKLGRKSRTQIKKHLLNRVRTLA